jgi:acyl-CoA synthetase (AMP-forming)/AMP-acid ligase II
MIITGGFNVFSTEVEKAVMAHPAIQDCAVIGVPDDKWGEAVKAVVELRDGNTATEAEIIALCKDAIGSVKAPKSVEFTAELPRSSNGKVLKRAVREQFWADAERQVH